jgi:DNA-binding transcriptional LysR family regulator
MIYPNLIKIRSFLAVADHGGFRKAAENLNLSQPALSAHVRDLETALGVPLFHRTTRSVRLTNEGENFRVRAKRALDELEAGVLELQDQAALQRGRVVIACVPTLASYFLPPVLLTFGSKYPGIAVRILDENAQELYRRVLSREADFGIGPRPDREMDIAFQSIFHDRFVAVCSRNHPLASRREVRIKDLVRYPIFTLSHGANVRTILESAFARQGFTLEPAFELLNHYTMGGMVESGLGITALPSMAISMLSNPLLKTIRIIDPEVTREVGILHRRDQANSPAVDAFLEVLSQRLKSLDLSHGSQKNRAPVELNHRAR